MGSVPNRADMVEIKIGRNQDQCVLVDGVCRATCRLRASRQARSKLSHRFHLPLFHPLHFFPAEEFLQSRSQLVEIDVINRRDVERKRLREDQSADHGQAQRTA